MATAFSPFPSIPSATTYHHPFPIGFTTTYVPGTELSYLAPVSGFFSSPITTQIDPNQPLPAANQVHGEIPHTYSPELRSSLPTDLCSPMPRLLDTIPTSTAHADLSYSKADEVRAFLDYDGNNLAVDLTAPAASNVTFSTKEVSQYLASDAATAGSVLFGSTSPAFVCSNTDASSLATTATTTTPSEPVHTEEAVRDNLAREIVFIQKRLQHQEYSLQSIQGEVANLSNRVAQIAISLGMQHIQDGTIHSQASGFALERDVQFGEMPICDVNDEETNSYLSSNEIPSPMSASTADQMEFQIFERRPIFDVYDDETDGPSPEFVDVFTGITEQQKFEDQPQVQVLKPLFEQLLRDFSKVPETEQTSDDMLDFTLEQQQQNDEKTSANVQQLRDSQLTVLAIHERRREWDPGALLPLMSSKPQHFHQALQPAPFSQVFQFGEPTHIPQQSCYCRVPSSQESHEIQFLWDPSIGNLMDMLLGKTPMPNLMDLKHFWAQLLLQYRSCCITPNTFLQVPYCYLPIVLDYLHSEPVKKLVCYTSMFSSNARCTSIAAHVCMRLVLCSAEITQEGRDEAAVYKALILQLPMSTNSDVWDPGVKISLYNWLNILTIWAATDKQLYCTHIPDLEARENAMHYCRMFAKCIGVSSQPYWHEDINSSGISLWLIHFLPP